MKAAFYTLGCKTNQYETQGLQRLFVQRGHQIVDFSGFADVYIINTCTVTALSDKKSRNACRRCKKINPQATVIVCGCYSQVSPREAQEACGADYVLGTADKGKIVDIAEGHATTQVGDLWHGPRPGFEVLPPGGPAGRTRALLKVQDGCQNFCTYCIIPFARGPCRSIPLETAVSGAMELEAAGYMEIVITGIEISSWGMDLPHTPLPEELICAIAAAAPRCRIRLGSLESRTVTESFAASLARHGNICRHFHLSLQSGCGATLAAMNRKYTPRQYLESCSILRRYFPGCAITSDLIVGFPGETRQDFEQSLAFVEECRLSGVHVFPFSPRKGTKAAEMPGQIPSAEKQTRAAQAAAVAARLKAEYMQSLVGKTLSVLFEQPAGGYWEGHSSEYIPVRAAGEGMRNKICDVRITDLQDDFLIGETF